MPPVDTGWAEPDQVARPGQAAPHPGDPCAPTPTGPAGHLCTGGQDSCSSQGVAGEAGLVAQLAVPGCGPPRGRCMLQLKGDLLCSPWEDVRLGRSPEPWCSCLGAGRRQDPHGRRTAHAWQWEKQKDAASRRWQNLQVTREAGSGSLSPDPGDSSPAHRLTRASACQCGQGPSLASAHSL